MLERISELIQQLASSVVLSDASDLPALADIHKQFEALSTATQQEEHADGALQVVCQAAQGAGGLVEKIILHDVEDEDASWQALNETIKALQELTERLSQGREGADVSFPAYLDLPVAPSTDLDQDEISATESPQTNEPAEDKDASQESQDTASVSAEPPLEESGQSAEPMQESALEPDDIPLVHEFIDEANGHLETAEAELLNLEDNPEDSEVLNAIFRSFHTIKGVAGFLNLKQIGALAHAAENLLDLARKGQLVLAGVSVDVVLESIDMTKGFINDLSMASKNNSIAPTNPALPPLICRIEACATGEAPEAKVGEILVDRGAVSEADVEEAVQEQADGSDKKVGAILVEQKKTGAKEVTSALREQRGTQQASSSSSGSQEGSVKVGTGRLDNLINMVGELVIAQAMVNQDVAAINATNQRLDRNMNHLAKITRELQDLSMSMRMIPIQGVFQKMTRLVRDLSRKAGKEVDLVVTGGETELDRNLVEKINDPLVHMVRNSVDHGISTPDERVKAGKPERGCVELKAYHKAGNIVIEIIDDGKGLNKERILAKAISQGVVKEGQELSDQEIFRLIFHAGLSTAEKITDVSGRGVGMDVVRKNIEALGGRVDIQSVDGAGSTFIMRLPLTLAVIDGQIVRVGDQRYILPIISIEQSIQPKIEHISTVQNKGEMLMVRGNLLPMFRLYKLFGVKPDTEDPTQALTVIVQDNERQCSLLVDELMGQQQVVIKSLGEGLGSAKGVSGGAILGDGNVSLILDVPGVIDLATAVD